jgi:predicted ATP-grasp superfamily ATP-dependent carboligase
VSEPSDLDPPSVDSVLTLDASGAGELRRPVLLVALTGWFDAAGVATTALELLVPDETAITIGEIDPDPFYDFTQERPTVSIEDGDVRQIIWPANAFRVVRTGGAHDLVVLSGVEPHVAWSTYVGCVRHVVRRLGCEAVVTVGASADTVPHSRMPVVVGSTADPHAARRLGLASPSYQGITGLVGVLNAELGDTGIPVISLRVGVPHYLAHAEHPLAVTALLRHLAHVLGIVVAVDLSDQIERWGSVHDEAVGEDDQLQLYVRMLESEYDRRTEAALASGDDLAARFEEYLRDERGGDDDPPPA